MLPLFRHISKRHKVKDILKNASLWLGAEKRWLKDGGTPQKVYPTSEYQTVFEDNFLSPLDPSKWGYAMPWGDFHPGYLHQYYDTDGSLSQIEKDRGLVLKLRNTPKTYKKSELPDWRTSPSMPEEFTIPTGVGFIHTREAWKYGWFEAEIKLPLGSSYWSAFWTSGKYGWPPEIDIFEAYTHKGPNYRGTLGLKDHYIEPNLHYGSVEGGTKEQYGPYNIPVFEPYNRFVQYVCHWESDFIKIYYDGHLVFQCTDHKVLEWFNKDKSDQFLILNHGLHEDFPNNPDESEMIIRKVRVCQKNQ
jgi:hypothetical protein